MMVSSSLPYLLLPRYADAVDMLDAEARTAATPPARCVMPRYRLCLLFSRATAYDEARSSS